MLWPSQSPSSNLSASEMPDSSASRTTLFERVGIVVFLVIVASGFLFTRAQVDRYAEASERAYAWDQAGAAMSRWADRTGRIDALLNIPNGPPSDGWKEKFDNFRSAISSELAEVDRAFVGIPKSPADDEWLRSQFVLIREGFVRYVQAAANVDRRPIFEASDRIRRDQQMKAVDDQARVFRDLADGVRIFSEERMRANVLLKKSARLWQDRAGFLGICLPALIAVAGAIILLRKAEAAMKDAAEKDAAIFHLTASEQKYRSIFDNAVEGMFQATPDGQFITVNRAFARMYGYESPRDLLATMSGLSTRVYLEPTQRDHLLQELRRSGTVTNFEFAAVRPDGRVLRLRENVRAVPDENGEIAYIEGTVEDQSAAWYEEQRRSMQYVVARVLTETLTIRDARAQALHALCDLLDWQLALVWQADPSDRLLRAIDLCCRPSDPHAEFEQAARAVALTAEESLAGQSWKTGRALWRAPLLDDGSMHTQVALRRGMQAAFVVPVRLNGEITEVIEFFVSRLDYTEEELGYTLAALTAMFSNLLAQKQLQEAVRASEVRKTAILDSALDAIIGFDEDGRIIEFNPAAQRLFVSTAEEAMQREITDFFPAVSARAGRCVGLALYTAAQNASGAGPNRGEFTAQRPDGTEFPVELSVSRIAVDGHLVFTAFLRDVSERKAAERISSELAAVVSNSNDAILVCTLEGVITSWNGGAERIYGYSEREAVGRPLNIILPPDRLEELPQLLHAVKRGQCLTDFETVRLRRDGKRISVSLTESPIRGEGGIISGLSSIARDITDRRRLEDELHQAQKLDAIGRLAGGIAHDFNNILTTVVGYTDLIIGQIEERHWMWKHLIEVRSAAESAAGLSQQLLAFSRRQPLFPRVFCLDESVQNMNALLRRLIGENIAIIIELHATEGRIKADPSQMEQVIMNLCVNSRDAMPNGGAITLRTENISYEADVYASVKDMPSGEYVKLSVADTGSGMTPDVLAHIFEPFFTTKERGRGTGLGLATCYGIVKQSGGYIAVESAAGKGTTFSVYMPCVEGTGNRLVTRKELGDLSGGVETILYVEDEINVRRMTAHVLRKLGYTVLEAATCREAKDAVESYPGKQVDILFADIVLPDAPAHDLAVWLRKRTARTQMVYTSGYIDENAVRQEMIIDGEFLQKPFTPGDLARCIRKQCERLSA